MRLFVLTIALILFSPLLAAADDLPAQISGILHDKLLASAQESILVARLGASSSQCTVIYRHDGDIPLIPASNLKVVTTSAALDRLGPEFKFRTRLVYHNGDLILIGDGDPTFGDVELLSRVGWDANTVFKSWADGLKKENFPAVKNIVVDDSIFEQTFIHPHWPGDQLQKRYMAEVAGMNLNANCLDLYIRTTSPARVVGYVADPVSSYVNIENTCLTGGENAVWLSRAAGANNIVLRGVANQNNAVPVSVTVHDAPLYAGTVLAETFANEGIAHTGDIHRDRTLRAQLAKAQADGDKSWVLLAIHETPIQQVMARANKDSMNLYAECLCKRLGAEVTGQSGSWENGPAAVAQFLRKIGVPDGQYQLDDGCGLSKQNAISAQAMVAVLMYDYFSPNSALYQSTLAVAGVDGTLDDRFRGTDLRGRVIGKSGFVNGVSCLSGFLHSRDSQVYAFSILINGIPDKSNSSIKLLEEKIIRAVDTATATVAAAN